MLKAQGGSESVIGGVALCNKGGCGKEPPIYLGLVYMMSVVSLPAQHGEDISCYGPFLLVNPFLVCTKTLKNRHIFLVVSKG